MSGHRQSKLGRLGFDQAVRCGLLVVRKPQAKVARRPVSPGKKDLW